MSLEIQQLLRPVAAPAPGTEIPGPRDAGFAQAFADLLVAEDLVDAAAIARARRAAEAASERLDLVMVKLGLISESDLCFAYATYCGLPVVGADGLPDQPVLADRLKVPFLKANRLLPISFDGRRVLIATADPFVGEQAKAISYMLEVQVDLAVITPAEIERALRTLYHDAGPESHADVAEAAASVSDEGSEYDIERLRDIANEAPVIRLVSQIISRAVERAASDVHIAPRRDAVAVRYRSDAYLHPDPTLPPNLQPPLPSPPQSLPT